MRRVRSTIKFTLSEPHHEMNTHASYFGFGMSSVSGVFFRELVILLMVIVAPVRWLNDVDT